MDKIERRAVEIILDQYERAGLPRKSMVAVAEPIAIAAVAAALRESEWRPIESAPKGEILIYWPAVEGRNAKIPMIRVDYAESTPFRKPSHWMPLPPPPAIDAARKEGV